MSGSDSSFTAVGTFFLQKEAAENTSKDDLPSDQISNRAPDARLPVPRATLSALLFATVASHVDATSASAIHCLNREFRL